MRQNPERIALVLQALEKLWKCYPHKRLGQLLVDVDCSSGCPNLFMVSDEDMYVILTQKFEEYIAWKEQSEEDKNN
jgi:hypothetical protein